MTEPVRKSYSLDELRTAALVFMQEEYGRYERGDEEARDRWYERLGMLGIFATWLFERFPDNGSGDGND